MKGEKDSFKILIITEILLQIFQLMKIRRSLTQYKYDFDSFGPLEL